MTAKDVMRRKVLTVRPEMTVRELAQLFTDHHISGAPVVDERGKLLGVVSQTDLVRHELEPAQGVEDPHDYFRAPEAVLPRGFHAEQPDFTRVRDVMTPSVVATPSGAPLASVVRLMRRRKIHRVIVADRGTMSGIITTTDLLRILARRLRDERA